MSEFQLEWLIAFVLTHLIEIGVALWILKPTWKLAALVFTATAITHPVLWFVIYPWAQLHNLGAVLFVVLGEGYVWVIESLWYQIWKQKRPWTLSAILNLCSFSFGWFLQSLFP